MSKSFNFTLISRKDEVKEATEAQITKGLYAVGIAMQRNVGMKAPVDTGRLAASITFATGRRHSSPDKSYINKQRVKETDNRLKQEDYKKLAEPAKHSVVVGTNVEYAAIKEFDGQQFSHYIRRGVMAHMSDYKRILSDTLSEIE